MSKLLDDSDLSLEFQTVTSIYPDEFEVISISSPDHFNSEGIFRSRLQLDSPISFSYFLSGNLIPYNFLICSIALAGERIIYCLMFLGEFHQCELRYLPRVTLHIIFPNDYPAKSPPRFTLSCVWLTTTQVSHTMIRDHILFLISIFYNRTFRCLLAIKMNYLFIYLLTLTNIGLQT